MALFFFAFCHATRLVGSQFPNQELNLGHGNDESEEELEPLDEVKEESEKAGFKLNI